MAISLTPVLQTAHLLFVWAAISAILTANLSGLVTLLFSKPNWVQRLIRPASLMTMMSLMGLWFTGLPLLSAESADGVVSTPLTFKLLLAIILSAGGLVVGLRIVTAMAEVQRPAVSQLSFVRLAAIVLVSSFSLTCWTCCLIVSLSDGINQATPSQLSNGFLVLWILLALSITTLICARLLLDLFFVGRPGNRKVESADREQTLCSISQPMPDKADLTSSTPLTQQDQESDGGMAATIKSCLWALFGVFCISFVTNLLMLTGPLFMLQIYDRVLTSRSIATLTALLVLVAVLFLFLGIMELLRSRILVRIGQRVDRRVSERVFKSVISVKPSSAKSFSNRLMQDLESVRQFFSSPAPGAIFDLPWTPLYFAMIFMFHWVLGIIAVSGAAVLFVVALCNEVASKKAVSASGKFSSRSSALVEAGKRNSEVLRSMGMLGAFQQKWLEVHRNGTVHHLKAADVSGTMSVISKVTRLFLQSLMLAAGAYFAVVGEISAGVIIAASIILSRALAPIEQMVGQWRNIIAVRQGFGRLSQALNEQSHSETRIALPDPKGFLSAERLYAGPIGSREPILKDLNFYVRPGDAMAVVGSNASGKSTLARVLVGVWPALRGNVRLDGASLNQWLPMQLGKSIGYLPQDVELFEGTVAENIARFDPEASAERILEAAKKAHVHDLIVRLPDGYGTRLGEGGVSISGGQRQRIAFARALYGNPSLIVLDEPNANLDNEGELALTAAITTLREEGRSVIVMAHRPNVLSVVNVVLVLKDGRQVSFGSKAQVLKQNVTQIDTKKRARAHEKRTASTIQS